MIDMHGIVRDKTWALLITSVVKGTDAIILDRPVDWKVGEEIAIAATGYTGNHTETFKIKKVDGGNKFTLDSKFKYDHYSEIEDYDGVKFPMRKFIFIINFFFYHKTKLLFLECEVILLTRNIKI